jgi:hypothetical protein
MHSLGLAGVLVPLPQVRDATSSFGFFFAKNRVAKAVMPKYLVQLLELTRARFNSQSTCASVNSSRAMAILNFFACKKCAMSHSYVKTYCSNLLEVFGARKQ